MNKVLESKLWKRMYVIVELKMRNKLLFLRTVHSRFGDNFKSRFKNILTFIVEITKYVLSN